MKKLGLFASMICFLFMVSCCGNCQKEGEKCCDKDKKECCSKDKKCCEKKCDLTEEQIAECKAFKEKWENFENLVESEQAELIAKKKAFVDAEREALKAKIAECEAKWAGFEEWTIAEQKAFLDNLPCKKAKKDCAKKCEKKCEKKCDKDVKACTAKETAE